MKRFTLLLAVIVTGSLTSMVTTDSPRERTGLRNHSDPSLFAQQPKPLYEKGMITVKVKNGIAPVPSQKGNVLFGIASLDELSARFALESISKRFRYNPSKMRQGLPDLSRIYRLTFSQNIPPLHVAELFENDPNIEYAEPVPVSYACEVPDDPFYSMQHFLPQIHAEEAWDIHKGEDGTEEVIIGIMDTGVDWDHEDLVENIWQNMGEDADGDGKVIEFDGTMWTFDADDQNGLDDDGNGFIDDFIGWDFFNECNDPDPEPGEDHGSHCAGLAAARTNNGTGVAGVSWNLKIMAMEDKTFKDAYQGIIYAAENGAAIISNSWGHYHYSEANYEAIQYAQSLGCIIVAAASNDNIYKCLYPASYPRVVCVASVSKLDIKATYSNFGPNVTVSAPGGEGGASGLFSTVINGYNWKCGTSMASPVAAGVLGLVKSYHPEWGPMEVITQVIGTADSIDSLNPNYVNQLGSGRVNAFRALDETGVSLPHELKLDILKVDAIDLDGDGIPSAGDTLHLYLTLQNFCFGGYDPEATFKLNCEDPALTLNTVLLTDSIPTNDYFQLTSPFEVIVDENASTHFAEFCLTISSQYPLLYGDTLHFELLIAPAGILVMQGQGAGSAYSGIYIKNYFENHGIDVFMVNELPYCIRGFDAAFISLGNFGQGLDNGTIPDDEMCSSIANFLEGGGNLYLECGTFLGILNYMGSSYLEQLQGLLSILEYETPLITNGIDSLTGVAGSIAEDLFYTGTTQFPVWYIDILTPNENGIAMLEENGYGVVAVQGEGEYGQKTVLMNYALSKLEAGEPGMTPELFERVCEYLGIEIVGVDEMVSSFRFQVSGYPNPAVGDYNICIALEEWQTVSIEVFDIMGNLVAGIPERVLPAGEQILSLDAGGWPAGLYFCRVRTGKHETILKIVRAGI